VKPVQVRTNPKTYRETRIHFWCPVPFQVRTNTQTYRETCISFLVPCTRQPESGLMHNHVVETYNMNQTIRETAITRSRASSEANTSATRSKSLQGVKRDFLQVPTKRRKAEEKPTLSARHSDARELSYFNLESQLPSVAAQGKAEPCVATSF